MFFLRRYQGYSGHDVLSPSVPIHEYTISGVTSADLTQVTFRRERSLAMLA